MFLENAFVTFISNKSKGIKLTIFYNLKGMGEYVSTVFCFVFG